MSVQVITDQFLFIGASFTKGYIKAPPLGHVGNGEVITIIQNKGM